MAWTVTETREGRVLSQSQEPTKDAAVNHALGMAETDGLLREDDVPEELGGPNYTRSELRTMLETDGQYEDGEVVVSIREV